MKIEQNFKNNDLEQETGREEAHNAWVEEMKRKQAIFGNFQMDRPETPIDDNDFWEVEPEIEEEDQVEKDEHLERVNARMTQVKQRQKELSGMKNSEDVREEKRELEKELKSLEEEIDKNAKNKEQERLLAEEEKKQDEHLERVNARMTQVKQRQKELSGMKNSEDVREEKRELEKEMVSLEKEMEKDKKEEKINNINLLRKEIEKNINKQVENSATEKIEPKKRSENIKKITSQLYSKISFYEDKEEGLRWFNIIDKAKTKHILDDLRLVYQTINFYEKVNEERLEKLSRIKGFKEMCVLIEKEPSIEKVNSDKMVEEK